jgi:hypothetical protein
MSVDVDQKADLSKARKLVLGGLDFYVLPMSLRNVLAVADVVPKLSGQMTTATLSAEKLEPMVEVLWRGLLRAHPTLTRDELQDLPISINALVDAIPYILEYMGGKKVETLMGEIEAASGSKISTGSASSPDSSSTSQAGPEIKS